MGARGAGMLAAALVFAMGAPRDARADPPSASPSVQLAPGLGGLAAAPPIRQGDAALEELPTAWATIPLRMTFLPLPFPQGSAFGDAYGCRPDDLAARGNTWNGLPMQRETAIRLTPRLTLVGFSQSGCPLDAGMGGGLVYAVPVHKNVWLAASAGAFMTPNFDLGARGIAASLPKVKSELRIDAIVRRKNGDPWTIGLGTRGLRFGGLF
jgi:hypothetical protein